MDLNVKIENCFYLFKDIYYLYIYIYIYFLNTFKYNTYLLLKKQQAFIGLTPRSVFFVFCVQLWSSKALFLSYEDLRFGQFISTIHLIAIFDHLCQCFPTFFSTRGTSGILIIIRRNLIFESSTIYRILGNQITNWRNHWNRGTQVENHWSIW